jgi:hypothetical protein
LRLVRVLEFVDEDVQKSLAIFLPQRSIGGEQGHRPDHEVVEVERAPRTESLPIARQELIGDDFIFIVRHSTPNWRPACRSSAWR